MRLGGYKEDDAREIHSRVLGNRGAQKALNIETKKTTHNLLYYVLLIDDLDPAGDIYENYTQATAQIIRYVHPSANNLNMEDSTNPGAIITITNRFESFSAIAGDVLLVIRNESEFTPITAVASSNKHARIAECLGNGYYSANLSLTIAFEVPSLLAGGTGTTEGVGTGSTLYNECDPCALIYGENTGTASPAVCGTLIDPFRVNAPGDGDLIYCYDPRKLSLSVGAHVIVTNMGDQILHPETGTGTGTALETIWMILTGNYDLVGIPDRFYTCCNDTVTLTKCDTYVVEGFYCPGQATDCPGTGTA